MLDLTPFLRLYAKRRMAQLSRLDCCAAQEQELLRLVSRAKQTQFGRNHDFKGIRNVADFQKRVPLRAYESFWQEYWRPHFPHLKDCTWPGEVKYFPVTSGTTTGATKYIPYSDEMDRANTRAALDTLVHHLHHRPKSRIFGGKNFLLGGSTDLQQQAPGVYSGDLSGIVVTKMPWWARIRSFPPLEVALLKNWEEKMGVMAQLVLKEDITSISGVPSWMLIFLRKLFEVAPQRAERLVDVLPKLELVIHGGVNFAPYLQQFEQLLEGSKAEMRETYPASEGFIASADRGYGEGLRLHCDNGIFFEFVPLEELDSANPTRHWLKDVELGVNYAIVLSTCAGVWSYIIGDTVKFVEKDPPRVLVSGRTSYCLSAFGEHLIGDEIEDGISTAAAAIDVSVVDYSVGAVYPQSERELGGHRYVVEFESEVGNDELLHKFADELDRKLCERNEDYAAHRDEGFGLSAPEIVAVKPGAFADWMKSRGKLGGQNKVPRIITDRNLFGALCRFMSEY